MIMIKIRTGYKIKRKQLLKGDLKDMEVQKFHLRMLMSLRKSKIMDLLMRIGFNMYLMLNNSLPSVKFNKNPVKLSTKIALNIKI